MSKIILAVVVLNTLVSFAGFYLSFTTHQSSTVAAQTQVLDGSSALSTEAAVKPVKLEEVAFFAVNKIIVSIPGETREHYFVLDLALYGDSKTDPKSMEKIEPLVRNSVVSALSVKSFNGLRQQPIAALQSELQQVLQKDFASLGVPRPFTHVLVSKLVVQ